MVFKVISPCLPRCSFPRRSESTRRPVAAAASQGCSTRVTVKSPWLGEMAPSGGWIEVVHVTFLHFMIQLVNGQIYFDTDGQHGWLDKISENDQLFKQIRETPECDSKPCSSSLEQSSGSASTSPIIVDKGRTIGVKDNSESLKIRWNLVIKQGKANKTTITQIDWKPKDEKDKDKSPIDEKIPDNKEKDKTPIDEKVPDDKDKNMDKTSIEEKIPNNKDKSLNPAPLVQVYVVASGNGGAHTNIGDGGYYGRNNGYVISTGSATEDGKKKWSGGFNWDEKDWKDTQARIPSQDWAPSSSWRIEDQKDVDKRITEIDEQSGGGFGEASTKYRIGYLGINLKPQSLAARTREKLLNWRLRFRR